MEIWEINGKLYQANRILVAFIFLIFSSYNIACISSSIFNFYDLEQWANLSTPCYSAGSVVACLIAKFMIPRFEVKFILLSVTSIAFITSIANLIVLIYQWKSSDGYFVVATIYFLGGISIPLYRIVLLTYYGYYGENSKRSFYINLIYFSCGIVFIISNIIYVFMENLLQMNIAIGTTCCLGIFGLASLWYIQKMDYCEYKDGDQVIISLMPDQPYSIRHLIIPAINTGVWNSIAYVIVPLFIIEYLNELNENTILLAYCFYGLGECIASGLGMIFYLQINVQLRVQAAVGLLLSGVLMIQLSIIISLPQVVMLLIGCTLLGLSDGFNYPTIKYLVIELNGFFIRNISAFFFWHYGSQATLYAISIALPRSVVKYHLIVAAMVSPLSALWLNWKIKHTNEYISDSDAQIIENLQLDLINETSSDRQLFNY